MAEVNILINYFRKIVFEQLQNNLKLTKETIHCPELPTRELLLEVMNPCYLFALNYSIYLCKCVELPICFVPSELLRYRLLNPMMLATQGTIGKEITLYIHNICRWSLSSFRIWMGH